MNLLSDAAQSETWPAIKPQLTKEKVYKALIFFEGIHYSYSVRPYTSLMAFLQCSKISQKLTSLKILM